MEKITIYQRAAEALFPAYQIQLLKLKLKVNEIIIAFDRQFETLGDEQFIKLKKNLIGIHNKYKNYTNKISFIFDKKENNRL